MRVSSLTGLDRCESKEATSQDARAAYALPEHTDNDASVLGTAYHSIMERWHRGETVTVEQIRAIAVEHVVEPEDLLWLWGRLTGEGFERAPITLVEEEISAPDLNLTGHPDLARCWPDHGTVVVDDWKTGRLVDHAMESTQIKAYAVLVAKKMQSLGHDVHTAIGRIWPVRSARPTEVTFEKEEIDAEWERIVELVERSNDAEMVASDERKYRTGQACTYCDGRVLCPAYRANAQAALTVALDAKVDMSTVPLTKKGEPNKTKLATARNLAIVEACRQLLTDQPDEAWRARALAGKLREGLDDAIRDHLHFFGEIECKDGEVIRKTTYDRTPPVNLDIVMEALVYADVDQDKRATVISRIEMREKVPASRMAKVKKQE